MAVAGLRETPYTPFIVSQHDDPAPRVLILGGGLSGMTAALTLAGLGVPCDLLERETARLRRSCGRLLCAPLGLRGAPGRGGSMPA